ncbi:MAG: hypothetical protein KatS3mg115_2197 [Candidatus Poribacteria bacterium]|nr:MAG: hypothetical protein KatS3mg115_2197 [Candidatus Poribacteria bacterium]
MSYYISKVVDCSYEEAIERVTERPQGARFWRADPN